MKNTPALLSFALLASAFAPAALAGDWSRPVVVTHDDQPAITYRARYSGGYLVVDAAIAPGWHTFSLDNKSRQDEKLAGKPSLGVERPTEISAPGLKPAGKWLQTEPADFSKPELRWYSWGYKENAVFAVKTARPPASVNIRGQACTDSVCKNINIDVPVPAGADKAAAFTPVGLKPVH